MDRKAQRDHIKDSAAFAFEAAEHLGLGRQEKASATALISIAYSLAAIAQSLDSIENLGVYITER